MDNHYLSFNSLLELLTGFNFAFVISDGFNVALKSKVVAAFDLLQDSLEKTRLEIEGHEKSVKNLEPIKSTEMNSAEDVEKAVASINKLNQSYKSVEVKVTTSIKAHSIENDGFSHLCLFSAFFCMLILLITPFYDDFNNKFEFDQTLFFYCLACLIYVFVRTLSSVIESIRVKIPETGYLNSATWFVGITVMAFLMFSVNHFFFFYSPSYSAIYFNLIFVLLIPAFHFIAYFVYAIVVSRAIAKNLKAEINTLKADLDKEYNNVLKDILSWHKRAEQYRIKPNASNNNSFEGSPEEQQ